MWPDLIVMPAPLIDNGFRFDAIAKPFHRQTFVAEFAVETLRRSVLPRLARVDECDVEILAGGPFQQRLGDEFWTVVRTQYLRHTMQAAQPGQHLNDAPRTNRAGHIDC